jgi:hypothetical protein
MSPELAFLLTLALRMAVTAAFIVTASIITERSGPVIGALVATLPISAGPSYVFLALDHDAAFIAEGAVASLSVNAATVFLCLTYVVLAQRHRMLVSFCAALAVWITIVTLLRVAHLSFFGAIVANAVAFAVCLPLVRRFRHVKMPLITRRWYDIPLRATLVSTLVATVVTLSGWVGPTISGVIALIPLVFVSMMLILHPRIGGPPTAAVLANSAGGMMGLGLAVAALNVLAPQVGSVIGLSLALSICVCWNLTLWWCGRLQRRVRCARGSGRLRSGPRGASVAMTLRRAKSVVRGAGHKPRPDFTKILVSLWFSRVPGKGEGSRRKTSVM